MNTLPGPPRPPTPPTPPAALNVPDLLRRVRVATMTTDGTRLSPHEPEFKGNEKAYLGECIDSGWVSAVGEFVDRFENDLRKFTGAFRVVATVNGTSALQLSLRLVGVVAGDEVLVPTLGYVETANAIQYLGAIPHFVDVDETTLGVAPAKLRAYLARTVKVQNGGAVSVDTGRPIRALVAVHMFGHACDVDALAEICREFGIELVENASGALGTLYKDKHVGTTGRVASVSFNGNKILTTGGGGALLIRDEKLGKDAKHLATTAKIPHAWKFTHDDLGYNFRMPNLNAALGCAQIQQLAGFVERKRLLADRYAAAFQGFRGARMFQAPSHSRSNCWLNALVLDSADLAARDALMNSAHQAEVMLRPAWELLHRLPMHSACPQMDVSTAENLDARLVTLPSSMRFV